MTYYPKISGEKCFLSPVSSEDGELWARWVNDLEVALPLGGEAHTVYPLERMRAEAQEAVQRGDPVFTIVDQESGQPLGRILLFNLDSVNRSAMLGIFIGEKDFWKRGYGAEALRLILDYGFNLLNLHSIMLGVFAFNERAIRSYHKAGFREIGRRREARIVAGKAYDVVFLDILEDEFRAVHGTGAAGKLVNQG
jgi:RimJ/RimL family protein N-acetyltransferase